MDDSVNIKNQQASLTEEYEQAQNGNIEADNSCYRVEEMTYSFDLSENQNDHAGVLNRYNNTGFNQADSGNRTQADLDYRKGLAYGLALDEGQRNAAVHEQMLRLYLITGFTQYETGNRTQAYRDYRDGLAYGSALNEGQRNAAIHELMLKLYFNTGLNQVDSGNRAQADLDLRDGLAYGEALDASQRNVAIHVEMLRLHHNTGLNQAESGNRTQADRDYWKGLAYGEALDSSQRNVAIHELMLKLYLGTGLNQVDSGNRAQADLDLRDGLAYGEALDASQRNVAVHDHMVGLYYNMGVNQIDSGNRTQADRDFRKGYDYAVNICRANGLTISAKSTLVELAQNLAAITSPTDIKGGFIFQMAALSLSVKHKVVVYSINQRCREYVLQQPWFHAWTEFLTEWLLQWHADDGSSSLDTRLDLLIRLGSALWLLEVGTHNSNFIAHFKELNKVLMDAQLQNQIRQWQAQKEAFRRRFDKRFSRLKMPIDNSDSIGQQLSDLAGQLSARKGLVAVWKRLRLRLLTEDWRRIQHTAGITDYSGELPSQGNWPRFSALQSNWCGWWAQGLADAHQLPGMISADGPLLLGLLATAQTGQSILHWHEQPPWADNASLMALLMACGYPDWIGVEQPRVAYAWAGYERLYVSPWFGNQANEFLDSRLRKFAAGDTAAGDDLRNALASAWSGAVEQAGLLARIMTALAEAKTLSLGTDVLAKIQPPAPIQEQALIAILNGTPFKVLAKAIKQHLHQLYPCNAQTPLVSALAQLKRQFSYVLSHHSATQFQNALGERLYSLAQTAINRHLAQSNPPLPAIWQLFEQRRIALTGLSWQGPDERHRQDLQDLLHQGLQAINFEQPDYFMRLLENWLPNLEKWFPPLPTPADCQRRMTDDDLMVQLFVGGDAATSVSMLLLAKQGQPQLNAFPLAAWPALSEQAQTLAHGTQTWAHFPGSPLCILMAGIADFLRLQAAKHRAGRIVLLCDGGLGQWPWETLLRLACPDFTIPVERAATLSHWRRRTPRRVGSLPAPIFLDETLDEKNIRETRLEAEPMSRFFQQQYSASAVILPTALPFTAYDALQNLGDSVAAHFITHGHYAEFDPHNSYLKLNDQEKLYCWTLAALPLETCDFVGLAACHSVQTGSRAHILATIGIGQSLIAGGVRRVLGALWKVNNDAAILFHHFLHHLSQEDPDWHTLLPRVQEKVRTASVKDIKTLLPTFDENVFITPQKQADAVYPFASPFYWAGFVLIGALEP